MQAIQGILVHVQAGVASSGTAMVQAAAQQDPPPTVSQSRQAPIDQLSRAVAPMFSAIMSQLASIDGKVSSMQASILSLQNSVRLLQDAQLVDAQSSQPAS